MAASEHDLHQIWDWNSKVPDAINNKCVHEIIAQTTSRQPEEIAIEAWDGKLNYRELDDLSSRVANDLRYRGVRPGDDAPVIPLCIEKSKWTSVAMLGIMKAGGISVALDICQPVERLLSIVQQTRSRWIICTATTLKIANLLCSSVVEIGEQLFHGPAGVDLPRIHPEQIVFVTFTSGSTGMPKGVCISHANVAAAVHYQGQILGFDGAKVLDFAPYSFDVAWSNMLHTLCAGGCLCIPTTNEMLSDLALCMDRYEVALVNITPTMLRTLDRKPATLSKILLSGEPASPDLLSKWACQVNLKNTYGPAECTFKSTLTDVRPDSNTMLSPKNIGTGTGAITWIVDAENQTHLVPIGEVGELWLEGPLVGQGYLYDAERTAAAFVHDPSWLLEGGNGRRGRLYRTGDLVRYERDGGLVFVGRKDRQAKVKGCRVELGDVEHHLRQSLACRAKEEIAVEVITTHCSETATLIAFLTIRETETLYEKLERVIPSYMIPSAFVYIPDRLPRTPTGKTDRRRLREMASSLTLKQLAMLNRRCSTQQPIRAATAMELRLRKCWAQVLKISPDDIGIDDNFFHLGGDSLRAVRLVGIAREQVLSFTVAEVFRHPKLCDLAGVTGKSLVPCVDSVEPFSLLKSIHASQAKEAAAFACRTDTSNIEDVFPCTPFQAGLFSLNMQRTGDYVSVQSYALPKETDLSRFRSAWESVAEAAPILRTCIVLLQGEPVQVVLRMQFQWSESSKDVDKMQNVDSQWVQFCVLQDQLKSQHSFVWIMHHALIDGFSRSTILAMVEQAYQGASLEPSPPFQRLIKHIEALDVEEASSAWKNYFQGSMAAVFPSLPSFDYKPSPEVKVSHVVENLQWSGEDITQATVVVTAWAMIMAEYTSSSDVVLGTISTGRETPVTGIERMTGPTAATVPFRLKLPESDSETRHDLLCRAQEQRLAMQRFEHFGLSRIRRVSAEAEQGCSFQTLLVVHPSDDHINTFFPRDEIELNDGASTYALMIACHLQSAGLRIAINFDSATIDLTTVKRMQRQFETILRQLCARGDRKKSVKSVRTLSDLDLEHIQGWNACVPELVPGLVHELLAKVVHQQPNLPAIHAWDGTLTYSQLDDLATRLARGLMSTHNLRPNDVVPICSEKSFWTSVMVLAVMKTGAASIMLDITQPEQRLSNIIKQVSPRTVLASPASRSLAARVALTATAIDVDSLLLQESRSLNAFKAERVKPSDTLCLIFTSGSSGSPKEIVITHENFSSALAHQTKLLGFDRNRRVFDFASHAFDAAYYNLLHTLSAGGCLCVPSEDDRLNDLSGSICRLGATFANFTPKLAELLEAEALRQLELLELSGETSEVSVVARLREHTSVRFAYGPAECSVMSTVSTMDAPVSNIGRGIGVCCWIISCLDPTKLAPVGCVGELCIEGPLVSKGYLRDENKTASAFVDSPVWLNEVVGRSSRVYRTGDLVRYTADGSLVFVGRNDHQIKVRGQRIELGEVAYHVQQCLNAADKHSFMVLAEVVWPSGVLVAFVTPPDAISTSEQELTESVALLTANIQQRLSMIVPSYMVPSRFVAIKKAPLTATGKIDKQRLRSMARHALNEATCTTMLPHRLTKTETQLRAIWARVLKIEERKVGSDSPFWGVGDSISAMSLLVAIRKEFGVNLKLSTLASQKTTLASLSKLIEEGTLDTHRGHNDQILADLEEMIRRLSDAAKEMTRPSNTPVCGDEYPDPSSSHRRRPVAFLTGSTGFLGTHILRELCADGNFRKVVVLVRSSNASMGLARVKRIAQAAGWWTEIAANSIEVWPGDLSKSGFDLGASQLERLAGTANCRDTIDTIIHNAAAVHWTSDFESLRATNVDSTFQLLTMAVRSRHMRRFVYVSGGRCPYGREHLDSGDEVSAYVKSKFVSERMVLAISEHYLQPGGKFAVVKPGCIIGDAETGAANTDDYLWRYVRTCVRLRAFPREAATAWLPVAEVSTVSLQIVRQAIRTTAEPFSIIKSDLPLQSFWVAIQAASGVSLSELDVTSWLDIVRADIDQLGESHPLWPVQQFLGTLGVERITSPGDERPQTKKLELTARLQLAVAQNLRCLRRSESVRGGTETSLRDVSLQNGITAEWT